MRTLLNCILILAGPALVLRSLTVPLCADVMYTAVETTGFLSYPAFIETRSSSEAGSSVFTTLVNSPTALAFDSGGNLYVADNGASKIWRFTPAGVRSQFVSTTTLDNVVGLAFDSAGNLYASDSFEIWKFTPGGFRSRFASISGADIAFDSAGNLFVGTSFGIVKFPPQGGGSGSLFADRINGAVDIAFDAAGNLFVADIGNSKISKFTPDGIGETFADSSDGISQPFSLAFDSAGFLYVNDWGGSGAGRDNRIFKFAPDGVSLGNPLVDSSLDYVTRYQIAFTDDHGVPVLQPGGQLIPEPATWALVGLGLPALLGSRPRRFTTL